MMDDVQVYSVGVVYCSVCARDNLAVNEIEQAVNTSHPTGVAQWRIAGEDFASGEPNPCPCNDAEDRKHWLLVC